VPFFAYTGRNAGGELVEGVLESADSGGVASQLFGTGITPLEIHPTDAPETGSGEGFLQRLFAEKVTTIDLLLFTRQLYTLLKSGVPIMQGLSGLQQSTTSKAFGEVLLGLRESLDSGREFSAALSRQPAVFSPFFIAMARVGETTGRLEEVLLRMYHHIEFEQFMRQQIKSATRYPMFVIIAMTVALFIINIMVIPVFAKVFQGFKAELPLMTRVLIGFSNFMVAYWPLLIGAIVGAIVAFKAWTRTDAGRFAWDRFKLKIPIAGKIILKATLARYARSIALAIRSGVPIVQGLSLVARTVDNEFIASRIEKMREGVERGDSVLRTSIASGIFTPVVLQMVAVGEESGALDTLMEDVAEMYQREVEYELKTLGSQIEPLLIVMLGVIVLILALGVFLPMWDLGKAAMGNK